MKLLKWFLLYLSEPSWLSDWLVKSGEEDEVAFLFTGGSPHMSKRDFLGSPRIIYWTLVRSRSLHSALDNTKYIVVIRYFAA